MVNKLPSSIPPPPPLSFKYRPLHSIQISIIYGFIFPNLQSSKWSHHSPFHTSASVLIICLHATLWFVFSRLVCACALLHACAHLLVLFMFVHIFFVLLHTCLCKVVSFSTFFFSFKWMRNVMLNVLFLELCR